MSTIRNSHYCCSCCESNRACCATQAGVHCTAISAPAAAAAQPLTANGSHALMCCCSWPKGILQGYCCCLSAAAQPFHAASTDAAAAAHVLLQKLQPVPAGAHSGTPALPALCAQSIRGSRACLRHLLSRCLQICPWCPCEGRTGRLPLPCPSHTALLPPHGTPSTFSAG